MNRPHLIRKAALAASAAALTLSVSAQAADWSDTSLGWRYGTKFQEPGNGQDIAKNIFSLEHASGYKYGSNFFNVDMLVSDGKDPAAGGNGSGGAHEVYVVYRHTLDFGKVFGANLGTPGVIRGYGLEAGFDLNSKDDPFGARKRMLVIGPAVMFDVPGFLQFALLFSHEKNHTAFPALSQDMTFKWNNIFEFSWGIPFAAGGIPFKFQGYAQYETAKGKDYFGADTKPEPHADFSLMVDVGAVAGGAKNTFMAGVEYEYWKNKFGNDPALLKGTLAKTPMVRLEYHF